MDSIVILDFGSQYTQLIARRIREANVYCELFPHDAFPDKVLALNPKGFILSGGPNAVYETESAQIPDYVLQSNLPILGICYGMQLLAHTLGGHVTPSSEKEFGHARLQINQKSRLLLQEHQQVWMSHGDRVDKIPPGFKIIAHTGNAPIAAMADTHRHYYGIQFHPEVAHTHNGQELLKQFVLDICGATPDWTPKMMITAAIADIQAKIGNRAVIAGVSGGVDSSVAAALVHQAVGDQLTGIFVNNGLLRQDEPREVVEILHTHLGMQIHVVEAETQFLHALAGVTEPEAKRRIIGEKFIRTFEQSIEQHGKVEFLVQGTIYPDVVESRTTERSHTAKIKTHHNVGGLPEDLDFKLIEPLRYMFKDEVRKVGLELGLPESLVWRQPFPGPGLAIRCLGEITTERLQRLRQADKIFTDELAARGLLRGETSQAFAVLLPVQSVGVMGDQRTYAEVITLRAVVSEDFMTADWARLPADLLAHVANRIVNEVSGINRVVYDITSKPPATIEWE